GDFDQAQAELGTALTFDRNNAAAQQLKSKIPLAKREFERDKHINSGVDLQSRQLYDAAIQEYGAALAQDNALPPQEQDAADIMLNMASAYQGKNDYGNAITWFQKALQRQPDLQGAKDGLKACQDRLKAKQLDETIAAAANSFKSGNFADALAKYQMLLSNNP